MKNFIFTILFTSLPFLVAANESLEDDLKKTTTVWRLQQHLHTYLPERDEIDPKLVVGAISEYYKRQKSISSSPFTSAWVVLDIISRYQLPGYTVVPSIPQKEIVLDVDDKTLESVVKNLIKVKTMPAILAKRPATSLWGSITGWAADHIPSIAADAKKSQLEALRAEIVDEYKAYRAAVPQHSQYEKKESDPALLALLPNEAGKKYL